MSKHFSLEVNEMGFGKLLIDGHPQQDVRRVEIRCAAGELTKVTIEYGRVTVEAKVDTKE